MIKNKNNKISVKVIIIINQLKSIMFFNNNYYLFYYYILYIKYNVTWRFKNFYSIF